MSEKRQTVNLQTGKSAKIIKWKVKTGMVVSLGQVILLYETLPSIGEAGQRKLKSAAVGTVRTLLAKEGDIIQPGEPLFELEKCTHPTIMKDMCAECGADLRNEEGEGSPEVGSIPMVHSIPELKVNEEQAQILGKADEERLLAERKLVLLVDLDQTLIHTTNDNIPANLKDVYHFQLHGARSPWYHTRLRPGTSKFLSEMSKIYELHICTFGSRTYAHMIAMFLDPDGKFFSHRILSRDECFSANCKTANLKALFPVGDSLVCIIDDREDVWSFVPNLIHVKPYHFFQHTGDINAPPGLAKRENDDVGDYDFNCLGDGQKFEKEETPGKAGDENKSAPKDKTNKGTEEYNICGTLAMTKDPLTGDEDSTDFNQERFSEALKIEQKTDTTDEIDKSCENIVTSTNDEESGEKISVDSTSAKASEDTSEKKVSEEAAIGASKENSDEALSKTEEENTSEKALDETQNGNNKVEAPAGDEKCVEENKKNGKVEAEQPKEDGRSSEANETNGPMDEKVENNLEIVDGAAIPEGKNDLSKEKTETGQPIETIPVGETGVPKNEDDEIDVQDADDYLLYLEEILKSIHKEFYLRTDAGDKPDLKQVVPEIKARVLKGTSIVFSGLVPNHVQLEHSRAYQVAVSLGANVTQDLIKGVTTHLVAVRPGTAKVNSARRMKNIFLVTADWLWTCAERWERVEERVFPLGKNRSGTRHPPAHCSPEHPPPEAQIQPAVRTRSPSGRFMDTINPLLSFSSADIADMDQEVEDIFNESESDGDDDSPDGTEGTDRPNKPTRRRKRVQPDNQVSETTKAAKRPRTVQLDAESESSSSSADSLSGEHPRGWRQHELKREARAPAGTGTESDPEEDLEESPSSKFRRGEALPSDLDLGEDESASQGSDEPPDEVDDGDWNMMGAALEREFLS